MSMSDRFSIVVFGASGFTGAYVCQEIAATWKGSLSWAVAGRSRDKLEKVISSLPPGQNSKPDIILADITSQSDLNAMAARADIVLNCTGPYRFYGEPVIKACLASRAYYLDLCGEPEFIEKMLLLYDDEAVSKNLTFISAAAFDSVPATMGVSYTKDVITKNGAVPTSVEMHFTMKSGPKGLGMHYATYQAAVEGFGSAPVELKRIRAQLREKGHPRPPRYGQKLKFNPSPHWEKKVSAYCVPYFFADPAIVAMTQQQDITRKTGMPPVQFAAYINIPKWFVLAQMSIAFLVFKFLANRSWGRSLLLRFPGIFTFGLASHRGPTHEQITGASFSETFFGQGYSKAIVDKVGLDALAKEKPDVKVVTRINGPEPGYNATPILFVKCVQVLLDQLRAKTNVTGYISPAIAFQKSDLIDRLNKDGRVTFSVVES